MANSKGKKQVYVFDLNKICDFIFDTNSENNNVDITENYVNQTEGLKLESKTITENKGQSDTQKDNIRYDLIKMFIQSTLDLAPDLNDSDMSFGEKVIINTLLSDELMKVVEA